MINKELQTIQVVTFTSGVDSYGQPRQTTSSTRNIQAVVKQYSNSLVENPKFNDCEYIVITDDRAVNTTHSLVINNKTYDVIYVIPSFRYNQLLIREIK